MKDKLEDIKEMITECIVPAIIVLSFIILPFVFAWEMMIRIVLMLLFVGAAGAIYITGPTIKDWLKEKFMKLGEFTRWIIGITCGCLIVGALMIVSQVREPAMETRSMASTSHVVYKTYTGKCYHRKSCGYLRSCIETTEAKAREEGLYPCSSCNP